MPSLICRALAVSAAFLLGSGISLAAPCARSSHGVEKKAEILLQSNDSKSAFGALQAAWNRPFGEADLYPDGWSPSAGESYRKAAAMFETGRGVVRNETMARHLNWMGSQYHDLDAMFNAGKDFYARGYRKDGEALVLEAAKCGHPEASLFMSELYGLDGDFVSAQTLLSQALDSGLPKAKFVAAEAFDKGALGLPQDYKRAFMWYSLAADAGIAEAKSAIAYYFIRGLHGLKDDLAATHWYHEAAKDGHAPSMTAYGWMLMNGKGGYVDKSEARHYFQKAQANGDSQATYFLKHLNQSH